MKPLRSLLAAAIGVLVLVPLGAAPANAGGSFRPGAAGVGDPYFPGYGNGGYDVKHYDLDVHYQPSTDVLTGRAVIHARATQNLSSFNLDFVGLTIDKLSVNGHKASYSRSGQELTVTRKIRKGSRFRVEVRYHGVPETIQIPFPGIVLEAGFIHTDDGALVAGQPEVAATWFPVNDHPQDKASYSFAVTVPAGLEAIANGVPRGSKTKDGWTTWKWEQRTPMISYLATATIGEFRISTTKHHGKPTIIAIDPDLPPSLADDAVGRTNEITDFLAGFFGPYPFEANGAIVDDYDNLFFALENQTRSIYSKYFFEEGTTTGETYVVAHELAHQWFGDSVAVEQWDDIWLNEGFATYAEWLWSDKLGEGTPQEIFDFLYAQPLSAPYWAPPPGDPGPVDLFDDSVYVRGAMTLQALRVTVGDADFWKIVRQWYAKNRNGHGSTAEFVRLAERVSGEQLDDLFQAWLFTDTKPPHPGAATATLAASTADKPAVLKSWDRRPHLRR
ncbi:M1 family metallopeptidase [Phytohabitans aurantiacus]|uniref:Aminopeptidase N n=1 Tax=Phytohabitans aurantiacus TaxID=3016789 RepID=A0ABQ5R9J0_9ACTN|nr:M1 family metallopeptidase [Phytohabitans aurantiacus]GLI02562.1 peptidase [Phytohabitans aurantiacus]